MQLDGGVVCDLAGQGPTLVNTFAPVTKAIQAKDFKAFDTAYTSTIKACNGCHAGMGYGFIQLVKLGAPADNGIDYKLKSEPGDVPK